MTSHATLPALDSTFGAFLLGTVVSAMLYGVTCVQTFYYFQTYSDRLAIKLTVAFLLIIESLHSAFDIHVTYFYVITNYFRPAAFAEATWSATSTLIVSSVIMMTVHLFYTHRLWVMSKKNIPLTGLVLLLALAHFGTGITVAIRAFELRRFDRFHEIYSIVETSLSLAVVTDVIIAAALSFYLHRSRSGLQSTDALINKLMAHTIENGMLTSVFDILTLIFVVARPDDLIYLSIFQVVGNLYTNSMLATLNSRRQTKAKTSNVDVITSSYRGGHTVTGQTATIANNTVVDTYGKPRGWEPNAAPGDVEAQRSIELSKIHFKSMHA